MEKLHLSTYNGCDIDVDCANYVDKAFNFIDR